MATSADNHAKEFATPADRQMLGLENSSLHRSPATPDQIVRSRPDNGVNELTPDASTFASTATTPPSGPWGPRWDGEQRTLHDEDIESSEMLQDVSPEALAEELAATLLAKVALEAEVRALRQQLAHQEEEYTRTLDAEHLWCVETVKQATDVACSLRDSNVQLTAEVDLLRARIGQLEMEAAEAASIAAEQNMGSHEEGNGQLISALQVEICDLERKLHRAHRSRMTFAETEEAALQKAEILQQQVQQMANLLEAEREEKNELLSALELVGGLAPRHTLKT